MVLTFESVDEILKCDHSNESSKVVLCCCNRLDVLQAGIPQVSPPFNVDTLGCR